VSCRSSYSRRTPIVMCIRARSTLGMKVLKPDAKRMHLASPMRRPFRAMCTLSRDVHLEELTVALNHAHVWLSCKRATKCYRSWCQTAPCTCVCVCVVMCRFVYLIRWSLFQPNHACCVQNGNIRSSLDTTKRIIIKQEKELYEAVKLTWCACPIPPSVHTVLLFHKSSNLSLKSKTFQSEYNYIDMFLNRYILQTLSAPTNQKCESTERQLRGDSAPLGLSSQCASSFVRSVALLTCSCGDQQEGKAAPSRHKSESRGRRRCSKVDNYAKIPCLSSRAPVPSLDAWVNRLP
jgi:hypothetical protein